MILIPTYLYMLPTSTLDEQIQRDCLLKWKVTQSSGKIVRDVYSEEGSKKGLHCTPSGVRAIIHQPGQRDGRHLAGLLSMVPIYHDAS